jgi:pyruvate kinase
VVDRPWTGSAAAPSASAAVRVDRTAWTAIFNRVDEAIAMATMYTANHLDVKAIAALTESGATPLWMSRISSGIPIYALTRHVETRRKVTLYRGVYPVSFDVIDQPGPQAGQPRGHRPADAARRGADGDLVIITKGD